MAYIATVATLADPTKHARLYFVLKSLFDEQIFYALTKGKFEKTFKTTKAWAEREHLISGLREYYDWHARLREQLHRLRGKLVIFLDGISPDWTKPGLGFKGDWLGIDWTSERNRLVEELWHAQKAVEKKKKKQLEIHYIQIAPVCLPFHFKEHCAVHSLEDLICQDWPKKRDFKNPGFQPGISAFSDCLFESSRAKQIYGKKVYDLLLKIRSGQKIKEADAEFIERLFGRDLADLDQRAIDLAIQGDCQFNLAMLATAYTVITQELQPKRLFCFATKSSYAHKLAKKVTDYLGIALDDFGGIGKAKAAAEQGCCSRYALSRFKAKINALA